MSLPPENYCKHDNQALARRTFTNGVEHFGIQCLDCGKWDGGIKKSTLNIHQMNCAVDFDSEIGRRFSERQRDLFHQEQRAKSDAWWKRYEEYIRSSDWLQKRIKVLERDNYICRACLKREATQVHHLTYRHFGWEPLFDLIAVCKTCHEYLHKKEREMANVSGH